MNCELCGKPMPAGEEMFKYHGSSGPCPIPLETEMEYHDAVDEIEAEAANGKEKWGAFHSAHEAFAVLKEEVDELWEHVKTNQTKRDLPAMKKEAMQVAAMALRFMTEVCSEERGRK